MANKISTTRPPDDLPVDEPQNLVLTDQAREIHDRIVSELNTMIDLHVKSPLDPDFMRSYCAMLDLFGAYQREIVGNSPYTLTCGKDCGVCCYHWAADVYSFEAEIIAEHIKKHMPEKVAHIAEMLREDARQLQQLDDLLDGQVLKDLPPDYLQQVDRDDLLLEGFYQLRRPCPLLDERGSCGIYAVRPMTCRTYMSFSDPALCDPDTIYYREVQTYLCDIEEEADVLLELLHERYDQCDLDSSMRTLLPYYLEGFRDRILKRII